MATDTSNCNVLEMEHLQRTQPNNIKTKKKSKLCILKNLFSEWHWGRWLIWIVFLSLSIFMCVLASFYYSFNEIYFRQHHYKDEKFLVFLHIIPAFWSQIIGSFQVCGPLRRQFINLHKWFGRIYVFCSFFASIGSFLMSHNAEIGGFSTKLSTMIASILWFCSTMIGFYYIKLENEEDKKHRIGKHRMWMIRSYGLMLSPVMFRLWILLFVFVFDNGPSYGFYGEDEVKYDPWGHPLPEYIKYESAYTAATWLCWVFNMIVVELYLWFEANQIQQKKLHL